MKRGFGIYILFIVLSTALGCKNQDGKTSYRELKFDKEIAVEIDTLTGEQLWGGTAKIQLINEKLYVVAFEKGTPTTWVHVFDTTGNKICDLIPFGRGPKEASMITTAQVIDPALCLFDPQVYKEISIIEDPVSGSYNISEEPRAREKWIWNCLKANDKVVSLYCPGPQSDETDMPRIVLRSSAGSVIDEYSGSPLDDEAPAVKFYLEAMRSCSALSNNAKNYAISYSDAGILQLFSISDRIKNTFTGFYYPHSLTLKDNQVVPQDKSRPFINTLYASESYLFASYDGEEYQKGDNRLLYTKIAVFDWKGRPRLLIKCDYRIEALCYSESDYTIYAVLVDSSHAYRLGKFKIRI